MNKKILATAITALLATSAQAANIYDADGMTVDVSGGVEIMYGKTSNEENSDTVISIDDADLNFDLAYDLGNDVTAVGHFETDSGSNSVDAGNVYVGFSHATKGTLTFGKQDSIFDDAGIFSDHELGIDSGVKQITSSTQVIKYTFDTGTFYGGVAYILNYDDDAAVNKETKISSIDGKIGTTIEGFGVTLFAGQEENGSNTKTNVALEVAYSINDLDLGAFYGTTNGDYDEQSAYGISAAYQMGKLGFAAGFSSVDYEGSDDNVDKYAVNVDYAFTSYVSVYAEVGGANYVELDDGSMTDDTEVAYNTGMIVKF